MNFNTVINNILFKNNINIEDVFCVLSDLSKKKIDYSDIYFQSKLSESWILENKIIKNGTYNVDTGVGLRAICNEMNGFAYTNQINLIGLRKITNVLQNILKNQEYKNNQNFIYNENKSFYGFDNPLNSLTNKEKINILRQVDEIARRYDSRISQVNACLSGTYENILVASTDGILATDIRPLVSLSIYILSEDHGKREIGTNGGGIRSTYQYFLKKNNNGYSNLEDLTKEAARISILNLNSKKAPSGSFPVILGSGFPGVLLHEAVGHGLEGDFNRKNLSIYSNKINKKVASNLCTIVDDGTKKYSKGSISIDDEGTPGQYNVLVKNGILKKYLQDKFNSHLMKTVSTGNGRRESYAYLPLPRMTNTYMLSGKSTVSEIIESVDYGIYAVNFSGGQVDITSGEFVFSTSEAYLIQKGKIISPIKEVTLIGSGIEIMNKVSMVGNDLKMDNGTGLCSKEGQDVPVSVGQPTIKIDSLTVGGTN
ncbi:metalloprotease TldD [Buchnera aphidicola]|uniref:metalloprotease TldD n=1 Tax=Buchnera aphidicola TaxID=9 RepID=UPI002237EA7B|nr:metalloprotease TldD [Buchnera aphidicola]MCW5197564.1 metalloprotease TldD [Buchnera aphidicola (Chaitophorus viminalis)]